MINARIRSFKQNMAGQKILGYKVEQTVLRVSILLRHFENV